MSDGNTNPTIEQAVETLRERHRELSEECDIARERVASLTGRIDELRHTIGTLTHLKPKRGRPRGTTNSVAPPPATQPGPYDDSVSLDEAQGVLT
jgi:hypothetical protein